MTDCHIHIGQFYKTYYDAHEVFDAIEKSAEQTGVTEVYYSSTSSCRYDAELFRIEEEIAYAQQYHSQILNVRPYLWFIPKYAEQGIRVRAAIQNFDYAGIKLHPFAQQWDLENSVHTKCLEELFSWSNEVHSLILIHCGLDKKCLPSRFESFFLQFSKCNAVLAHSNPIQETMHMMKKYRHIRCDSSFCTEKTIKLLHQTFGRRVLFGTDFPITHYWQRYKKGTNIQLDLQYKSDCTIQNNARTH